MIVNLSGVLLEKEPGHCVVDVGGVGYGVRVSLSTFGQLPNAGEEVKLPIHTYVREDQLVLYGFATAGERALFCKLISISGVGPKLALAVLSGLPPDDLVEAIGSGDAARLSGIPGIGKKTASRMIVELKGMLPDDLRIGGGASGATRSIRGDAVSALMNLGYPKAHAESALDKVELTDETSIEEAIRTGLKELCKA
jgi:Holliday junction DNA helicase RuvA